MKGSFNEKTWFRISLLNLLIVALLGVVMRYKIGFEFPYFQQKHLQHSHSHFAFTGWITQSLLLYLLYLIRHTLSESRFRKYTVLLNFNLLTAYGMLISFIIEGYAFYSILFSTLSILLLFVFTFWYFHDLKNTEKISCANWIKAALVFNLISSLGTALLTYIMVNKLFIQQLYLVSVYWYLHFHYNGWFFFACMGLLVQYFNTLTPGNPVPDSVFRLLAVSCIPAVGLSMLWLNLPPVLYWIVVLSAAVQLYAWIRLLMHIRRNRILKHSGIRPIVRLLLIYLAVAFSIKLLLQLGSSVPAVSTLAFGFRPVIIAYLHLILLAILSVGVLTLALINGFVKNTTGFRAGLIAFVAGVFLNELGLGIQGVAAFSYIGVPHIQTALFGIGVFIFLSAAMMLYSQFRKTEPETAGNLS